MHREANGGIIYNSLHKSATYFVKQNENRYNSYLHFDESKARKNSVKRKTNLANFRPPPHSLTHTHKKVRY